MSVLTEPLTQLESAVSELETRVNAKVEDAEKKLADVPSAEELARLNQLTDKIKNLFH